MKLSDRSKLDAVCVESIDWSGIAAIALGAALYAPAGVLALAILGLLWAPAGALACAAAARIRGLDASPCAAAGAKSSAVMFLPCVYLFIKLASGRPPPALTVKGVYALAYAVWLCMAVVKAIALGNFVYGAIFQNHSIGLAAFGAVLFGALLGGNVYTLRASIERTLQKRGDDSRADRAGADSLMPDSAYLTPFGWLIGWAICYALAFALTVLAGMSRM